MAALLGGLAMVCQDSAGCYRNDMVEIRLVRHDRLVRPIHSKDTETPMAEWVDWQKPASPRTPIIMHPKRVLVR